MSTPPRGRSSFWDWFLVGAGLGVAYQLIRNPGGCACALGCVVLLFLLLLVVLIVAVLDYLTLIALVVVAVALAVYWPRIRGRLRD